MKIIPRSTCGLLTILLFAHVLVSLSSVIVGGTRIETRDGVLHCDSMICPSNSRCEVTKRNAPNNRSQIIITRKCFDINGAIIAQETKYEPNRSQGSVNMIVVSGGGGNNVQRPFTPQEQKALEGTLMRADESLRQFRDGSFERNLQNRISESFGYAFHF